MAEQMAAVGWQGITLMVPADWSLVGVSGDEKKGYFRVDGPIASALEVRWASVVDKSPDLMVKAREFLSGLEKNYRKKKIKFSSKIKPDSGNEDSVSFNWQANQLGQGRLFYCDKCKKIVIAQVISVREENISHIIPVILESLTDHRDDGWVNWALYGLAFAIPSGYKIQKQQLMSGYLSLSFKNKAKILVVERWGLANTLLAGDELKEWYRKDVQVDIKGYRVKSEAYEVAGHDGLKTEGRRSGIKQMFKAIGYYFTLYPHPGYLTGYAWHCKESNRLFSIRATHIENDDVAEKVRDFIKCH